MATTTIKQNATFTVKGYNPMMSVWMEIAKLGFYPDEYTLDRITTNFVNYTYSTIGAVRVYNGNKILKEIEY